MQERREFPIKKNIRKQLKAEPSWFSLSGDLVISDQKVALQLAEMLHTWSKDVQASELNAFGLLHEIEHYMIQHYRVHLFSEFPQKLEAFLKKALGKKAFDQLLKAFCEYYPPTPVFSGKTSVKAYMTSNRQLILEELMLLWIDHLNPAFEPVLPLIEPNELKEETAFASTFKLFDTFFKKSPPLPEEDISLFEFLQRPARLFPHSVQSQLEYIAEHWQKYIPEFLTRVLSSLDFIKEEKKARFDLATFGPGPSVVPQYTETPEPERFSPDQHWMPRLVLIAKSTYVWLDQLSKKYEQSITRLDQIPDEELERLARFGISGLWLIGIWERSRASQRIKQRTGNPEALASAYSLYDYVVAEDLGGADALQNLKERAWRYGIRMATDMVPNHTGIDSRWIIEHPDWFIQLPYSPFPKYTFNGPDLCDHQEVGIFIEDGYWDRTDAAVVFKRVHYPSGDTRFIYHGNDGTSMPWNDTAQLNYLNPEVREAVIQKILEIARQFPIIRFDAAMTLTKKHFQRLWFPEPGSGGDIPSRAQFAMSKQEFDQHMPEEFWREVVDRVQQEVPDTLLLAEAFWLMEGYFVRTLGMHRVYNSAFMNMLKNEENDKFRLLIKNTLAFNPQILKRYVNFMNNPDEETAVVQFGKGDKYFGVCTMMATLPGLPMFGHGQLEGFVEKYGMEYRRAYWDEEEDSYLVQQHFTLIAPLLKKRYLFSDVEHFLLYDLYTAEGQVNENVFAYSNRLGEERALILYNNSFSQASGWIHQSASIKINDSLVQKTLWQGLHLAGADDALVVFRDHVSNLFYLRELKELKERGLFVELGAYKFQVYLDFQIVSDSPEKPYRALCRHLNGKGTADLQKALKKIVYQPLHQVVQKALDPAFFQNIVSEFKQAKSEAAFKKSAKNTFKSLAEQVPKFEQIDSPDLTRIDQISTYLLRYLKMARNPIFEQDERLAQFFSVEDKINDRQRFFHTFLVYYLLDSLYKQSIQAALFEERLLQDLFKEHVHGLNFTPTGHDNGDYLLVLQTLCLLPAGLPFNKPGQLSGQVRYLFNLQPAAQFLKIHSFQDVLYFNKEHFEELIFWLFILHLMQICKNPAKDGVKVKRSLKQVSNLSEKALLSGYRVEEFLQAIGKKSVNKRK